MVLMLNYNKKNSAMKKIILAFLSTLFIIILTSCGDGIYIEETTAVQLTQKDFLVSLQQGLQKRWDAVDSDTNLDKTFDEQVAYYANLVDIEYVCLSKYLYWEFEDPEFQSVVKKYLDILKEQFTITRTMEQDENVFKTKWNEYSADRNKLIKIFYEKYGLSIDEKYNKILFEIKIDTNKDKIPASIIEKLNGRWECEQYTYKMLGFNEHTISFVTYYDRTKQQIRDIDVYFLSFDKNDNLVIRDKNLNIDYSIKFIGDDKINIINEDDDKILIYTKTSDFTFSPELVKDPYIGMPKEELIMSTWGTPKRINKTTTEYGVSEQWVYERYTKNVYIYLTNGYVTIIQE